MRNRIRTGAWLASGLLGGAVLTGVVVSQVSLASADTPSAARAAVSMPGAALGMHGGRGGGMGMGGKHMMGGRVLHGESTVEELDGDYVTVSHQRGEVTAVSATSITVKSKDGFSRTYAVNSDTVVHKDGAVAKIADIKTGETVGVQAIKSGSTWTAKHVGAGDPPRRGPAGDAPQGGTESPTTSS